MSTSLDFEFNDVLEVALGRRPKGLSENQEQAIKDRLDRNIKEGCIASLTVGLDPAGVQTSQQRDSLNHSVIYVKLEDDGVARFSMENNINSKKGTTAPGELIMKFQDLANCSWKEVMSILRPWKSEVILTLRHLMILAHIAGVDKFIMSKDLVGCRYFA